MRQVNLRALAVARDRVDQLMEDERAQARQRKEFRVTHMETKYGHAKRPPSLEAMDAGIDDWNGVIASALDAARRAEQQERDLASSTAADPRRFPVIKEG